MSAPVNHEEEHNCPVYGRVISSDLCYDSAMCLLGFFKVESTRELNEVPDIEEVRAVCKACEYSNME
ncbi:MAG: hypothetical protein K6A90_08555 [Lachnospiraceae bacterium]|nr:hypothetical protein [Lachnospiraceae bacterium]